MYKLHPYLQADIKYTINNVKCNYRYMNLLKNKKKGTKKQIQSGGVIFGNNKYKFDFKEDIQDDIIIIFIGNKENCITAIIYKDNPDVIELQSFGYYKSCNIYKNLERKEGTIQMMNIFIDYIKQKYINIRKIILTDNSSIKCNNENYKKNIQLYNLYLFKYGCGYYEKHFNFTLIDDLPKHKMNLDKYKTITLNKQNILQFLLNLFNNDNLIIQKDIENFSSQIIDGEYAYKFILRFTDLSLCYIFNEFLDYLMTENKLYKLYGSIYEKKI